MTFSSSYEQLPADPILGLQTAFLQDTRKNKVNLGIGAYKNGVGESQVFDVVRKVEPLLLGKNKEYLPIEGSSSFIKECKKLVFGEDSGRVFAAQTVGGTSALRIGGDLLKSRVSSTIYLPNPTWVNHTQIFTRTGMRVEVYPYYNPATKELDFEGMVATIKTMPSKSTILLHGCCHNPTGIDPSQDQWKILSKLMMEKEIFPFFDLAYQGFGQGIQEDVWPIIYFMKEGHEMLVATSYSKNFGLYGERIGVLAAVANDPSAIGSHIKSLIRTLYSSPPLQGERIITTILQDPLLKNEWELELGAIRQRIQTMREALTQGLMKKEPQFSFLKKQLGMFSFTGLSVHQVERLLSEKAIHMPKNGRINVAGLNPNNLEYVIESIIDVL